MANDHAYRYEVEMRVRSGKGSRIVTRIEHAYNVVDAIMQAGTNHVAEHPGEQVDALVHVGPPADAIGAPPQIDLSTQILVAAGAHATTEEGGA